MFSFIKALIYMSKTLSGRLPEPKIKEKSSWVIPKVVAIASIRERSLTKAFHYKVKSRFKRGFTKVVGTRAGRLREWS